MPRKKSNKRQSYITFRADPAMVEKFKKIAAKERRTISQVCYFALQEYLEVVKKG